MLQIKRFMAGDDAAIPAEQPPAESPPAGRVLVIGAGAAGLAAALHLQVFWQAHLAVTYRLSATSAYILQHHFAHAAGFT